MSLALITGAARANSIAAGIVPRLVADGWDVVTSDLSDCDYPCDLSTSDALTVMHPLGRLGTPADIGALVAYLVGREGRWVSGQLINADGAFSARY